MQKLLIATTNKGKLQEIFKFLSDLPVELVSLEDVGITDDVEENGETYEENSRKKAIFYSKKSGLPTIADDGGLEIDALNGKPGVRSRRWLGYEASNDELFNHMKKVAFDLPDDNRDAKFVLVLSFVTPDGFLKNVKREIKGVISKKPFSEKATTLPYRLFFYFPELGKYYEELTKEEHNKYNHRRIGLEKLKPVIKKALL